MMLLVRRVKLHPLLVQHAVQVYFSTLEHVPQSVPMDIISNLRTTLAKNVIALV